MEAKHFSTGAELYEYVVAHGPEVDPDFVEFLRGAEPADAIYDYLVECLQVTGGEVPDELFAIVRENIRLVGTDEYSIELADFVGAPWDCFA